jgi:SPX domain protein involved in polyphosphate accumulation
MRFEKTLKNAIYPPWSGKYIDYPKLKKLLREDDNKAASSDEADEAEWTEQDEEVFVQELVNVQLDKVNSFQSETNKQLRDRISQSEAKLEGLMAGKGEGEEQNNPERQKKLEEILKELDDITKETNELEKYSRINFTGFLKAAKKHDGKGLKYRVRPLLQVRLAALPFNSEDYSPLLYRLSAMYSFIRQNMNDAGSEPRGSSRSEVLPSGHNFSSYRYWVHPENLMEVKTYILRRLPVLVYNPQTSKIVDGARTDPSITSLYLDNSKFDLYTQKVDREGSMSSVRFRWYGQLNDKPEIYMEKKTIGGETDENKEIRFKIKDKHIQGFLKGEYKMEKDIQKVQDRAGAESTEAKDLQKNVEEIQKFVLDNSLSPVLRANYTRTAFQIPGDDRVRISLDTDLVFIREDSFDSERPCRDPDEWHRTDIDNSEMEFPFSDIRKGEISRFPFALLEIKVRDGGKKRHTEWINDLMSSHLVKEAPRFSKFVNGVAQLFEDSVNSFPFWLPELDTDIRKDPEDAFQEEQEKVAKRTKDEIAVGSYLGTSHLGSLSNRPSPLLKPAVGSPVGKSYIDQKVSPRLQPTAQTSTSVDRKIDSTIIVEEDSDGDGIQASGAKTTAAGFKSIFPSFPSFKALDKSGREPPLPPGVQVPSYWIKDTGAVKVEAKVWLANQRTFVKWQHIAVLLASLSLGLYNAAGRGNTVARVLAVVYTAFAVFAGLWGWWLYLVRSRMIQERSGKDFDNVIGPVVVCVGLTVALCLNFGFKV